MNIRLQNDNKPEETSASSDIQPREQMGIQPKPASVRKKRFLDFPGWGYIYRTVAPVLWILIIL